jgi:hypothetical protein
MVMCWFGSRVGANLRCREVSNCCEQQLRGNEGEFGLWNPSNVPLGPLFQQTIPVIQTQNTNLIACSSEIGTLFVLGETCSRNNLDAVLLSL